MTMQESHDGAEKLLTFTLADQLFGVPVLQVNDVLSPQRITPTPLAPSSVSGVMNLRGRIVTAIDVRKCLGQVPRSENEKKISVVVDSNGELFSLMIDAVGDVISLTQDKYESTPATLDARWRSVSSGIYKLENKILVILDVEKLLSIAAEK